MEWIFKYLGSKHFQHFHSVVDSIPKNDDYRSWIGLNFDGSSLYSVKFYYTWFRPLTKSEIEKLLFFGSTAEYWREYKKVSLANVLNIKEPGSGFTFVLKLDTKLKPTYGYYFKQAFDENDSFFDLTETKTFLKKGGNLSSLSRVKNHGIFYKSSGKSQLKNYYYIENPLYKSIISEIFADPIIATSPVIEYALGKGHRSTSKNLLSKKKVVVFGDFNRLSTHYLNQWHDLDAYTKDILKAGFYIYSPGIYADMQFRSIYIFNIPGNDRVTETLYNRVASSM